MLDALTIKQWLAVYFTFGVLLWCVLFAFVWRIKGRVDQLVTESELVRFLQEAMRR